MSNELIISTAQMPDYIREMGGYVDEGLSAGVLARAPKFGITIDKAFTVTYEGQAAIIQGADGYPARTVVGVIIAASDTLTKAWYEGTYEAGSFEAPDCFSNDGKVPSPSASKPQHSNCAGCPKNAFGSHPVTGRGKACSDRKMIVMVTQGEPDRLLTFNVPTMSLQALAKLNSDLKQANIALQSVAVQFSFDMNKTYSVVKIGTVGFLNKDAFLKYKAMSESDEVRSLLREVDYEAPAQQASAVVPQNVINFGGATGGGSETAVQTDQGAGSVGAVTNMANTAAAGTAAPVGRKRRTKAEMEAARSAEAAVVAPAVEADVVHAAAVVQNVQAQPDPVVTTQAPQTTDGGQPAIMDLLAKWKTS